jgi:serine protease inhibitor
MYFILPNEGINVNELVNDDEVLDFIISNGEWENKDDIIVNLTIPRMNISSDINLKDGLSKMGVQDCFTLGSGNFSGIVKDDKKADDLFVNKINHNVSVVVDNEGVTGYAYTQAVTDVTTAPIKSDINFTVNRPFIFVITGADGSVLFIGIVNQPNK